MKIERYLALLFMLSNLVFSLGALFGVPWLRNVGLVAILVFLGILGCAGLIVLIFGRR
jgi:hypothetical protein